MKGFNFRDALKTGDLSVQLGVHKCTNANCIKINGDVCHDRGSQLSTPGGAYEISGV